MKQASINKRCVSGVHITTGAKKVLAGPTGTVEKIDGNMVTIITPDGYRCSQCNIMGAVTFHDNAEGR